MRIQIIKRKGILLALGLFIFGGHQMALAEQGAAGADENPAELVSDEKIQSMLEGNVEKLDSRFYLDLDADGQRESVSFQAGLSDCGADMAFDWCRICVDDTEIEQKGDMTDCGLYGISLDGERIWLLVHESGFVWADEKCTLYSYEGKELKEAGTVYAWADSLSSEGDGQIWGKTYTWALGDYTFEIEMGWQLDDDGMLAEIPQESCRAFETVTLLEPITVYEDRDEQSPVSVMQPQKVRISYIADGHWAYLEGEDGAAGWFCSDGVVCEKIFSGLYLAD